MGNPYDSIAEAWHNQDRPFRARGYLDRILKRLEPGASILDLGCGTGRPIARYLIEQGFRVVGVDESEKMLEIARLYVPEVELIHADMLEEMDLREQFSVVIAWDSIFHIARQHHRALFGKIRELLKTGGWLLVSAGGSGIVRKLSIQIEAVKAISEGNVEVSLLKELITEVRSSLGSHRMPVPAWDQPFFTFPEIKTQDDLGKMLIGTTWRKKNNVEHVIFDDERSFYNNHAGHPTWRKNSYTLDEQLGSITVVWSVDGMRTQCRFNKQFNEFVEMANPSEGLWSIIATKRYTPPWGI